ncbi:MAG: T9SS type A sorting domain-containing protein [Candidatus Latescibacterota bacterium]|nr:MAG: T9SS type A sorting domain-containing protein [Candidatus Latescibacterota bacterium]
MKNSLLFLAVLILVFAVNGHAPADAQTFPVQPIMVNGATDDRINIVFLSEGYTSAEMSQFILDVQSATIDLFDTPPYEEYELYFNVYAIEVPSVESGTDHPYTASDCPDGLETFFSNTYFNSTFDFGGIHRLLVVQNSLAVSSVLTDNFPEWDVVFIVVNHPYYGGSGGSFATFSTHTAASEVAIHELGHSFADLADEYEYGGMPGYEAPNATAETQRELIRWNNWIELSTPIPTPETPVYENVVGLFEGAVYNPVGWYRPKLDCKMRALGIPFCEVCAEQTIISVYNILSTIEDYDPPSPVVTLYQSEIKEFSVTTPEPTPNTIETTWSIDGMPVAVGTNSYWLNATEHGLGTFVLDAVSRDTTELVRTDPGGLLEADVTWTVEIDTVVTAVGDVVGMGREARLYQNVPNPFNPVTTIRYYIPEDGHTTLIIFDVTGEKVKTLVDGMQTNGEKTAIWDGLNDSGQRVSSGIYFYKLHTRREDRVKKMLLVK